MYLQALGKLINTRDVLGEPGALDIDLESEGKQGGFQAEQDVHGCIGEHAEKEDHALEPTNLIPLVIADLKPLHL